MTRLTALVLIVGGAVTFFGAVDWSGVGYAPPWDRELAATAGIIGAGAGIAARRRPGAAFVAVPATLVGLVIGFVNYRDVADHRYEFAAYPEARVGVGLYLVLAGSWTALVATLIVATPWIRSRALRERRGEAEADEDTPRSIAE